MGVGVEVVIGAGLVAANQGFGRVIEIRALRPFFQDLVDALRIGDAHLRGHLGCTPRAAAVALPGRGGGAALIPALPPPHPASHSGIRTLLGFWRGSARSKREADTEVQQMTVRSHPPF